MHLRSRQCQSSDQIVMKPFSVVMTASRLSPYMTVLFVPLLRCTSFPPLLARSCFVSLTIRTRQPPFFVSLHPTRGLYSTLSEAYSKRIRPWLGQLLVSFCPPLGSLARRSSLQVAKFNITATVSPGVASPCWKLPAHIGISRKVSK